MARRLTLSGYMKLQDYEPIGANELKKRYFNANIPLSKADPQGDFEYSLAVGGEVRGEMYVQAEFRPSKKATGPS